MSNRTWRLILGGLVAALLGAGVATAGSASAAPITCPGGQTAVAIAPSSWECVNNGGNTSNAEDPKSPQADKNKF